MLGNALGIHRRVAAIAACLLLIFTSAGVDRAVAAGASLNLGRPTNDVPQYLPLGGFRRVRSLILRSKTKPELLWIGTQVDPLSAVERWPLIKALEQFGTFSGVTAATTSACPYIPGTGTGDPCIYPYPTFDWSRASYRSRYLEFVHRDLLNRAGNPVQTIASNERTLFNRYLALPAPSFQGAVQATLDNTKRESVVNTGRRFPLVAVTGYLLTALGLAIPGDFVAIQTHPTAPYGPGEDTPLSFATVQSALIHDKLSGPGSRYLVTDLNVESNVITTLICHVDGEQPHSVCSRPAIRQLLRHAR